MAQDFLTDIAARSISVSQLSSLNFSAMLFTAESTIGTERDKNNLAEYTTLGEYVATNYARIPLTGNAFALITAPDRIYQFNANPITWPALDPGTIPQVAGALIFLNGASDTQRLPVFVLQSNYPVTPNGLRDHVITPVGGFYQLKF